MRPFDLENTHTYQLNRYIEALRIDVIIDVCNFWPTISDHNSVIGSVCKRANAAIDVSNIDAREIQEIRSTQDDISHRLSAYRR